jgi:hypothetical protein
MRRRFKVQWTLEILRSEENRFTQKMQIMCTGRQVLKMHFCATLSPSWDEFQWKLFLLDHRRYPPTFTNFETKFFASQRKSKLDVDANMQNLNTIFKSRADVGILFYLNCYSVVSRHVQTCLDMNRQSFDDIYSHDHFSHLCKFGQYI